MQRAGDILPLPLPMSAEDLAAVTKPDALSCYLRSPTLAQTSFGRKCWAQAAVVILNASWDYLRAPEAEALAAGVPLQDI